MGNLAEFLIGLCKKAKGRELKTAARRQAYSPEGYYISLLPTINSRRSATKRAQKKPFYRGQASARRGVLKHRGERLGNELPIVKRDRFLIVIDTPAM